MNALPNKKLVVKFCREDVINKIQLCNVHNLLKTKADYVIGIVGKCLE